jgi:hypothetical protein
MIKSVITKKVKENKINYPNLKIKTYRHNSVNLLTHTKSSTAKMILFQSYIESPLDLRRFQD